MNLSSYKNPLYTWYVASMKRATKRGVEIYPEWANWNGFIKWLHAHGYEDGCKLHYSSRNPFTPEFLGTIRSENLDYEYIAYDARDPYELIVTSAPYIDELASKLKRMGYDYTPESIRSALSRNEERVVDERVFGLIFEKIDLSNYNEDEEPFESKEID